MSLTSHIGRKTKFSFSKCFEKMVFPKKSHWNMTFLVSSGEMIFLFPENMILFFRRKMTDSFSKKCMKIWYMFYIQMFWKDDLSSIIRNNGISFDGRKMKDDLSQKIHRNMMFSVCSVKMIFLFPTNMKLHSVKKPKMIFSWKIHLKVTFPALLKKKIFILEKMTLPF